MEVFDMITRSAFLLTFLVTSVPASAQADVCAQIDGAIIVSDDGDFLGKFSNKYDSKSIFNEYGTYGSEYNSTSIWNKYGEHGSEYRTGSWRNSYSSSPPKVIKDGHIIGYLTVNKNKRGAINPIIVGAMCYDFEPS